MHIHDIVIIGGGISGLFLAYNLIQKGKHDDILLVESSSELGGRIRTERMDGYPIEMGGARFSDKHVHLLSLLEELGLKDKMVQLPKEITYIHRDKKINYDLFKQFLKLMYQRKKYKKEHLEKVTLFQYAVEIIGQEETKKLQEMFGYDAEFLKMNAYSALTMFQKDLLDSDTNYYVLQDGLSEVIQRLQKVCEESGKVKIQTGVFVKDLQDKKIKVEIDGKEETLRGLKIISTMPYLDVRKMDIFKDFEFLHCVKPIPLVRVYAQYPVDKKTGKVWFHGLNRTITDNMIRHIIPIDYEKGIIMISYTDFYLAEMWNNWNQLGEGVLTERLHTEIHKLFKIKPPKPTQYKVYYWRGGVHMWRTKYPMDETYPKLVKPFSDKEIYLSNESFSKHQCWIEGSLLMARDVLKKMGVTISDSKPKKLTQSKKNVSKKGGGDKKEYKQYTLEQVLRHRSKNWIIFEHGGKKWVYKISKKWFQQHPGGESYLKDGVKANSYYDTTNTKGQDKSPTELFKSIGAHGSGGVFKKYILEGSHPDKIKKIGLLK